MAYIGRLLVVESPARKIPTSPLGSSFCTASIAHRRTCSTSGNPSIPVSGPPTLPARWYERGRPFVRPDCDGQPCLTPSDPVSTRWPRVRERVRTFAEAHGYGSDVQGLIPAPGTITSRMECVCEGRTERAEGYAVTQEAPPGALVPPAGPTDCEPRQHLRTRFCAALRRLLGYARIVCRPHLASKVFQAKSPWPSPVPI